MSVPEAGGWRQAGKNENKTKNKSNSYTFSCSWSNEFYKLSTLCFWQIQFVDKKLVCNARTLALCIHVCVSVSVQHNFVITKRRLIRHTYTCTYIYVYAYGQQMLSKQKQQQLEPNQAFLTEANVLRAAVLPTFEKLK